MKDQDRTLTKLSSSSALHPKPISMSTKSRAAAASKTEKKRSLVALRLAMLGLGTDEVSNIISPKEERLTPEPITALSLATIPTKPEGNWVEDLDSEYCTTKRRPSGSALLKTRERSSHSELSAMKRAEEVQASLSAEHPSLVKNMLHSHTASGFWLGLPKKFCDQHLPTSDTMMKLIDGCGKIYNAKYLAAKAGLSGGWRGFSIAHNLEEGDVVVFHLVERTTFKVYIIRQNALGETDGALGLLDMDTCANVMISLSNDGQNPNNTYATEQGQLRHPDSCLPSAGAGGEEHEKMLSGSSPSSEGLGSEVLDWITLSESESVNLESFDKFSILLDGSVSIDAKFPDHIRRKYYNLCTNLNSPLHKELLKGLNCTLVVGIINETINIYDATRVSNNGVPESELLLWDRTLQGFELLGMNVGFIRMQIHELLGRALERDEAAALEVKAERELTRERMRSLEVKLLEMRKGMEEIDDEMEMMEESTQRKRIKLQEMTKSSCHFTR